MQHATNKSKPQQGPIGVGEKWNLDYLDKHGLKEDAGRFEVRTFLERGYPRIARDAITVFGMNDEIGFFKPEVTKAVGVLLIKGKLYCAADAVTLFKLTKEEVEPFQPEVIAQLPGFVDKVSKDLIGWKKAVCYVASAFEIPDEKVVAIIGDARFLRTDVSVI